eukprot:2020889-Prymnesium_polylepis.1
MVQTRSSRKAASPPVVAPSPVSDDNPCEIAIRMTFHGQLRLMAGGRPPMAGQPGKRMSWKSCQLTTQQQFDKFLGAVNSTSYSKT